MTDQEPDHTVFDELAAGYVLHALEPADEQRFLQHAGQCARCRQTVAEFRMVAGALAETAPPAEPGARLGERIMAVARADLAEPGHAAAPPADSGRTDAGTARDGGSAPDDSTVRDSGTAPHDSTARDDGTAPDDETAADQGTAAPAGPAPGRVVPLRRRAGQGRPGWRWQKPAAAAAAAVLIAVGGIWAGLAATSGGPPRSLAACAHPQACPQVTLTSSVTHQTAARVVVNDGVAWMEPSAMQANPADEIYVLWQVTGAPVPMAVGSFDVKAGTTSPIRIGALPAPYHATQAFAVSLEHGREIPPRPSTPVAAGKVS
jgi:anti-sigma-K factor RskA